jgi:hypothetical protein
MNPTTDDVSPRTEKALRDAMQRLLDCSPKHTDGRLTKANLGREAGVSHATLFRAKTILTEWDTAVAGLGKRTRQQARYDDETNALRASLAKKNDECADLRRRLDAAATVIATLHHENSALRQKLVRNGTVVALNRRAAVAADTAKGQAASPSAGHQSGPNGDAT